MEIPSWSYFLVGEYLMKQQTINTIESPIIQLDESDLCILDILYSGYIRDIHEIFI